MAFDARFQLWGHFVVSLTKVCGLVRTSSAWRRRFHPWRTNFRLTCCWRRPTSLLLLPLAALCSGARLLHTGPGTAVFLDSPSVSLTLLLVALWRMGWTHCAPTGSWFLLRSNWAGLRLTSSWPLLGLFLLIIDGYCPLRIFAAPWRRWRTRLLFPMGFLTLAGFVDFLQGLILFLVYVYCMRHTDICCWEHRLRSTSTTPSWSFLPKASLQRTPSRSAAFRRTADLSTCPTPTTISSLGPWTPLCTAWPPILRMARNEASSVAGFLLTVLFPWSWRPPSFSCRALLPLASQLWILRPPLLRSSGSGSGWCFLPWVFILSSSGSCNFCTSAALSASFLVEGL